MLATVFVWRDPDGQVSSPEMCVHLEGGGRKEEFGRDEMWGIDQVQAAFCRGRGRTLKLLGQSGRSWGRDPASELRAVKPDPWFSRHGAQSSLLLVSAGGTQVGWPS